MHREVSRQEYLKKRELQKLEELRDSIEDEERMFAVRSVVSVLFALTALTFLALTALTFLALTVDHFDHHVSTPLSQGVKLSRQERLDLEMRKQKLKYAEELLKAREALDNLEEYRMPDMIDDKTVSKRYEMLTERYRDPDAEDAEAPWKEQENWENERLKQASMKVRGAVLAETRCGIVCCYHVLSLSVVCKS